MRTMRIAVAGATGNIGARTVAVLEQAGHEVVRISRSLGADLTTGHGLDAALVGVEAVIDAIDATRQPTGTTRWRTSAPPPGTCSPPRNGPVPVTTYCSRSSASIVLKGTRTTPASASRSAS